MSINNRTDLLNSRCSNCSVCDCHSETITLVISDITRTIEREYCQKCYDVLIERPKGYWINRKDSYESADR